MKIGVLTYHKSHNYGAFLQAFALTSYLRKLGYDCEIINYNAKEAEELYLPKKDENFEFNEIKYNMFNKCLSMLPLSESVVEDNGFDKVCKEVSEKYDIVIVGSDEVWKTNGVRGFPNVYWLPAKMDVKKVAYAVSSRTDFSKLKEDEIDKLKQYVKDFDYIGIRDKYSINQVSKCLENPEKIHQTCDPTFLYDFKASSERGKRILVDKYKIDKNKKIILIFTTNKLLVKIISKMFKKEYNVVAIYNKHDGTKSIADLTPFELLDVIKCSDLLVTSFFHGTCFAIQNNTNFVADDFREKTLEQSKIYDLLEREDLLDNFVSKHNIFYIFKMIKKCKIMLKKDKPDFSKVVDNERNMSKSFFDYLSNITKE